MTQAPAPTHTDLYTLDSTDTVMFVNNNSSRYIQFELMRDYDALIRNGYNWDHISKEVAFHPDKVYESNSFIKIGPQKVKIYDNKRNVDKIIPLNTDMTKPLSHANEVCLDLKQIDIDMNKDFDYEARFKNDAELLIIKEKYNLLQEKLMNEEESNLNNIVLNRIKELEREQINIDNILSNSKNKLKPGSQLSKIDNCNVMYEKNSMHIICKINNDDVGQYDIYATGTPQDINQSKRAFSRTKLTLNVKFGQALIPAELDSGSGFSIVGIKTLQSILPDFQETCEKVEDPVSLFGVTTSKLDILGAWKIPIYAPVIGLTEVVFRVINNNDITILGKDFLCEHEMQLSFGKDHYKISFPKSKKHIMLYNNSQVMVTNKVGMVSLNLKPTGLKRGLYVVELEHAPSGIDMVNSLISIKGNKKAEVNLITGTDENMVIPENSCIFKISSISKADLIRPENVTFDDLSNPIDLQETKLDQTLLPESYSYYYKNKKDYVKVRKLLDQVSNVDNSELNMDPCIDCLKSSINCQNPVDHVILHHEKHCHTPPDKNMMVEKLDEIFKVGISTDFEIEDLDSSEGNREKEFQGLQAENNLGLRMGEIGVPHFKSQKVIEEMVDKKLQNLPSEVKNILKPCLIRNESLSLSPWDIPCCSAELDFEVDPLPKEAMTKVYPVRPEYLKSLFGTLQMLLYNNIITHAPVNMSFGSPLFCIKRKPVEGESSRQLRILLDSRICNKFIRGSTSASMTGCMDNLRNIVKNTNFMSSLDLRNMFYSILNSKRVLESGITQFTTPFGVFRLLRAVSGGALSPSFANMTVLKNLHLDTEGFPCLLEFLMSFYDDITLGTNESYDLLEHATILANVISRINKMGFQINMEKSQFCIDLRVEKLEILGMNISKNSIEITPKRRNDVINSIKPPSTKKQLQQMIGLLNYLRDLMSSDDLKMLSTLSTKLKNNSFVWDKEGDDCLTYLKNSLETKPFLIQIPNSDSIPLLFCDASEHTVAGILWYLGVDLLQYSPPSLPKLEISTALKNHLDEHKIPATPLLEEQNDFFLFLHEVHKHYMSSENLTLESTKIALIDSLRILMPQLLSKVNTDELGVDRKDIYMKLLREYDLDELNLDNYTFSRDLLLTGLSYVLNRQICIFLISDTWKSSLPFIKLTSHMTLSPVMISYYNDKFQLVALQKSFQGLQPYSLLKLDDFSSADILKIYKNADKNTRLRFGGVYSFSLPLSYKSVPIFMKEMLALSCSLNYFAPYIKMSRTFVFVDSSTLCHGIRQIKSRSMQKLHRIGLILSSTFPLVRVFLCPSAINPADMFTRSVVDKFVDESKNMTMRKFITEYTEQAEKYCNTDEMSSGEIAHSPQDVFTEGFDTINRIDSSILTSFDNQEIHLLAPGIISKNFEDEASFESIKRITLRNYTNLADGKKYELKDGLLFHLTSGKVYLPEELYLAYILSVHSEIHHQGQERTFRVLDNRFFIHDKTKFKLKVKDILNSCVPCSTSKATFYKPYHMQSEYGSEIMQSLTFDIIESVKWFSPHSQTPVHSVLGIIDNCSKYIEIFYLSKGTSNEVYNALLSFFSKHRFPAYVHADNSTLFRNKKIYGLFEMFGVKFNRSSPYASRSRTFIERIFRQLRESSRIFCNHFPGSNELIAFILFIKVHNHLPLPIPEIYMTPHIMVHHEHTKHFYIRDHKSVLANNYHKRMVIIDQETLSKEEIDSNVAYDKAVEIIRKKLDLHKLAINKNRKPHGFKISDIVIPKNFSRERKSSPMYLDDPSRIIEIKGSMVSLLSLITGLVYLRHVMHVKRIRLQNHENLPIGALEKYKLYTREYIEDLIKNSKRKSPAENSTVLTRAQFKLQQDKLAKNLESPELEDESNDNSVEFHAVDEKSFETQTDGAPD